MIKTAMPRRAFLRGAALATGGTLVGRADMARAAPAAPRILPAPDTGIANLSLNENPWGPSPRAREAMLAHIDQVHRYAGEETRALVQLIAERESVPADMVVLSPGSAPILRAVGDLMATDRPGSELITAQATFEVLYRAFAERGGTVVHVPFDASMRYDLEAMAARIGPSTGGVYVCNPNNPTGTALPASTLSDFAIEASRVAPVFIDEAYIDMPDEGATGSLVHLPRAGHNVIVCRTFSKLHALAAARLGYAIMPAPLAARIRRTAGSGGLPRLGVVAAMASLQDDAFITQTRARLRDGRLALERIVRAAGLEVAPDPQANFVYARTGMVNSAFVGAMASQGVQVVRRSFPEHDHWNRICVGTDADLQQLQRALSAVYA
ncbi:MAG: histidinol-phosphate transaminase [Pseudomonadales bacterium]|jgi:histidinol-phosphate aminotransferase|nr:histidinol-phosphate transaminase [Pseudomonadales bacterium]